CNQSDEIWNLSDERMAALATEELSKIGIIDAAEVLDSTVIRMEKIYPAYFGTYDRFGEIREHVDRYGNLFLIGRNGMHRYNNQDHSMLTAMMAVDDIIDGKTDKNQSLGSQCRDRLSRGKREVRSPERLKFSTIKSC